MAAATSEETRKLSLNERFDKIRSQPKLQNQQQTAVVLSAVEDTLRVQSSDLTPAAYFAALLSLLTQYLTPQSPIVNKDVAYAVVYLLDLVTPHVPAPLLRSKFSQILTSLASALTHPEAEAPLLRAAIGVLESLLCVQDAQAWALSVTDGVSPRRALAGLLQLAVDHRPKVRKRASDAVVKVLKNGPPSPRLDHPAADMCAETALRGLSEASAAAQESKKKNRGKVAASAHDKEHEPRLIHALQLVKTIAGASGGWPSRKIDALCELLLRIAKGSNEYLTMAAFDVFEAMFEGMADEMSAAKLPRLMEVIEELRPNQNDSQLLPPWIAVLSRGYDVASQVQPEETFQKLPDTFALVAGFVSAASHNIRVSASEGLISFLMNCIPTSVITDPTIFDEKALEKLAKILNDLLSVKYQSAWMEVFNVLAAAFDALRWRSSPLLNSAVRTIGELRSSDTFAGKKEADAVLSKAIHAMGPDNVLEILPLNLAKPVQGQPGRAWMLPLMRDAVHNTHLGHFRSELIPLSDLMLQRVVEHGDKDKTMEIKIYETVVAQIWATLPGYCDLPLDLVGAFDQSFAELVSNMLYQHVSLRTDLCRALQNLVDSNKAIASLTEEDDALLAQSRVSKADVQKNLEHLAQFASPMLAVLSNVYTQTLPQYRGAIIKSIDAYLSITPEKELIETFSRVATMLESSLAEAAAQTQANKDKQKKAADKMPPMSHTLMDLAITISIYLPRESYTTLFNMASLIISREDDAQLQKKAYKLIPRLAESELGRKALQERNGELQQLLLSSADKASAPSRRDRLVALSQIIDFLPQSDLYFIPSILSEVVISCKEVNEKARAAAFDLLVRMGQKMGQGGVVMNSKIPNMPADAPDAEGNIEEYVTMVSAGLAGSTPHMISASITALTRILYEFHSNLKQGTITEMVQTMDLFLTSANREIVRSVLGFVKVSIISLPSSMVLPRMQQLIPNLMVWSHEHKAHFRAKVKHILERMIRRFGADVIERHCPDEDKKLIANIRKTRERKKRRKDATEDGELEDKPEKPKGRFESEFDEAVYGSDDDESDAGTDASDDEVMGRSRRPGGGAGNKQSKGNTYILEDDDEPLDLLSKKALGNISTTKPLRNRQQPPQKRTKARTDIDSGKLILGDSDDENAANGEDVDVDMNTENMDLASGINAYVAAIRGKDAARRGQKGKLKFSNKPSRAGEGEEDGDEMDVDDQRSVNKKTQGQRGGRGGGGGGRGQNQRRGLGMGKTRGGRVMKSPRGGRGGRGGRR